ncbi:MAG: bifunctional (p)ppGpp synthetase/guanosine-3',5'-bis(diphosphate) 3'-pyrophosphohydrolase [Patescibacteria group bacterium]|nr:bifunctional (p)ppGpp synthetase/guanosine-3',5'-bis(diphosphate) 3'-pyrophosphohydrolase [Patescibacteria group bacterium]
MPKRKPRKGKLRKGTAYYRRHHYVMPPWLRPKLKFLLSRAENSETFLARIVQIWPPHDPRYILVSRAYEVAKAAFDHQKRSDGERYFEHLRATALIAIVYLRIRSANIIAALLLHDILEDLPKQWTYDDLVQKFNTEVAGLVSWVTKPALGDLLPTKDDVDRRYHRRLRGAPREAVLIKLCDRLHNLITIWSQPREKILKKISETRDFILPLAEDHQLLIHEIEDVLSEVERRIEKSR